MNMQPPQPADANLARSVLARVLSVLEIDPMGSPEETEEIAQTRARAVAAILMALDEGESRPDVLFSRALSFVAARC